MSAVSFKIDSNIIERREGEPLIFKARETASYYQSAAGVGSAVLDHTGHILQDSICGERCPFREVCLHWHHDEAPLSAQARRRKTKSEISAAYPCASINTDYLIKARENGGAYIFTCRAGLVHWTSPLHRNGRLYGALIAGKVLGGTREEAAKNICAVSGGGLSVAEALDLLKHIPEKTHAEVKALARVLLVCADQVSKYAGIPHDTRQAAAREKPDEVPREPENPVYPFDKEKLLLAALRRGDIETGRKFLNELVKEFFSEPKISTPVQHRAVELVTLLSRAAMSNSETDNVDILAANDRCLQYIRDAKEPEDIANVLRYSLERIGGKIFSFRGLRHASALRRAERFIWENYTRKISLREIAKASGLSAPYFSTIFKKEMGENLSSYLNYLRVNRAAAILTKTKQSLDSIALSCGFEDQSWFSKIFKLHTGMSPGKFREQGKREGLFDDRQKIRFGA
ncbi:MAG: helix-turn-helix domain-containing protein [Spirochaetaceae bacterium]|jgi:AraC-like DNA-binding protein/ligand-binding sensor protein|nr:helix-turn-helix domain-containing protein [Spirochaetaceae bacterium]